MARKAGRATPVFSNAGGVIRGWVPAHVQVKHTLAEERAINAAEAVKHLYAGRPVATRVVARQLDRPADTVKRWLDAVEPMNLVCKPDSRMGWMPV